MGDLGGGDAAGAAMDVWVSDKLRVRVGPRFDDDALARLLRVVAASC